MRGPSSGCSQRRGRGEGAAEGAKSVGAWPPAPPDLPWSPYSPSASVVVEGGPDLLPGCPASRAPGEGSVALLHCCSVRAQRGTWGILVSDSGVCGVLAGLLRFGLPGQQAHSPKAAELGLSVL